MPTDPHLTVDPLTDDEQAELDRIAAALILPTFTPRERAIARSAVRATLKATRRARTEAPGRGMTTPADPTPHVALVERLRGLARRFEHADGYGGCVHAMREAAAALSDLSWLRPVLEARLTDDVGRRCCSVIRGAQPLRVGWQGASR